VNARPLSIVLAAALLAGAAPARSEDVVPGPWKYKTDAVLTLTQSAFSSNWAGGDRGAIVWILGTDSNAERQFSTRFNLSNHLVLAYGQTSRQVPTGSGLRWDTPEKSTDKIEFESTGRWTLQSFVDPYFALRLDSQFLDQSSPIGDLYFTPIRLKETAGLARVLRKTEDSEAITRLGFGFRQTMAKAFVDAVTKETESSTSNDGGFEWQTSVTQPMLDKKVLYKGQLLVFQPVFFSGSSDLEDFDARVAAGEAGFPADPNREAVADFWKSPDVNFQNTFSASITKYLGVVLFMQLVYDKFDAAANIDNARPLAELQPEVLRNVRKAGQFKQTLALTLTYRLF
jgi:hypothetical protein